MERYAWMKLTIHIPEHIIDSIMLLWERFCTAGTGNLVKVDGKMDGSNERKCVGACKRLFSSSWGRASHSSGATTLNIQSELQFTNSSLISLHFIIMFSTLVRICMLTLVTLNLKFSVEQQ